MKRTISFVLSCIMLISCFYGIDFSALADDTVNFQNSQEILDSKDYVYNDEGMTKEEFYHNLVMLFDLKKENAGPTDNYYTDVSNELQYYDDILLCQAFSLVEGKAGGELHPEEIVTREFVAHTLNLRLKYVDINDENNEIIFADVNDCDESCIQDDIVSVEYGWFELIDGNFMPKQKVTTEEFKAIIVKITNSLEKEKIQEAKNNWDIALDDSKIFDKEESHFYSEVFVFDADSFANNYPEQVDIKSGDLVSIYKDQNLHSYERACYMDYIVSDVYNSNGKMYVCAMSGEFENTNPARIGRADEIQNDVVIINNPSAEIKENDTFIVEMNSVKASYTAETVTKSDEGALIIKTDNASDYSNNEFSNVYNDVDVAGYINPEDVIVKPMNGVSVKTSYSGKKSQSGFNIAETDIEMQDFEFEYNIIPSQSKDGEYEIAPSDFSKTELEDATEEDDENVASVEQSFDSSLKFIVKYTDVTYSVILNTTSNTYSVVMNGKLDVSCDGNMDYEGKVDIPIALLYIPEVGGVAFSVDTSFTAKAKVGACSDLTFGFFYSKSTGFRKILEVDNYNPDANNKVACKILLGISLTTDSIYKEYVEVCGTLSVGVICSYVQEKYYDGKKPICCEDFRIRPVIVFDMKLSVLGGVLYEYRDEIFEEVYDIMSSKDASPVRLYLHWEDDKSVPACTRHDDMYYTDIQSDLVLDCLSDNGSYFEYNGLLYDVACIPIFIEETYYATVVKPSKSVTDLVIPKEIVKNYGDFWGDVKIKVIGIRDRAFAGNKSLKTVKIEARDSIDGVWTDRAYEIGESAFEGCESLESVTLPHNACYISAKVFKNCKKLKEVNITGFRKSGIKTDEKGIKYKSEYIPSVGQSAFEGCSSLEYIDLDIYGLNDRKEHDDEVEGTHQHDIESIGSYAFKGCTSLKRIDISNTCRFIGYDAFYGCENLVRLNSGVDGVINMPKLINNIWKGAFDGCRSITEVVFSNKGAEEVGTYRCCESLKKITMPLTKYEEDAFTGTKLEEIVFCCSKMDSINILNQKSCLAISMIKKATFEEGIKKVGGFLNNENLTEVYLPSTTEALFVDAFSGCTKLKKVIVNGKSSTADVTLPDGITNIPDYAFENCKSIETIDIPSSVTSIGKSAFLGCSLIKDFKLPDGITSIGSSAFSDCSSIKSINLTNALKEIGPKAFSNALSLESVDIPESIDTLADYVFMGCTSLSNVTLPDTLTSIGYGVFSSCHSLENVVIPDSVVSIDSATFGNCISLKNITLSNSLTRIGYNVFSNCVELEEITLPKSVVDVGDSFKGCKKLSTIRAENPEISIVGSIESLKYLYVNGTKDERNKDMKYDNFVNNHVHVYFNDGLLSEQCHNFAIVPYYSSEHPNPDMCEYECTVCKDTVYEKHQFESRFLAANSDNKINPIKYYCKNCQYTYNKYQDDDKCIDFKQDCDKDSCDHCYQIEYSHSHDYMVLKCIKCGDSLVSYDHKFKSKDHDFRFEDSFYDSDIKYSHIVCKTCGYETYRYDAKLKGLDTEYFDDQVKHNYSASVEVNKTSPFKKHDIFAICDDCGKRIELDGKAFGGDNHDYKKIELFDNSETNSVPYFLVKCNICGFEAYEYSFKCNDEYYISDKAHEYIGTVSSDHQNVIFKCSDCGESLEYSAESFGSDIPQDHSFTTVRVVKENQFDNCQNIVGYKLLRCEYCGFEAYEYGFKRDGEYYISDKAHEYIGTVSSDHQNVIFKCSDCGESLACSAESLGFNIPQDHSFIPVRVVKEDQIDNDKYIIGYNLFSCEYCGCERYEYNFPDGNGDLYCEDEEHTYSFTEKDAHITCTTADVQLTCADCGKQITINIDSIAPGHKFKSEIIKSPSCKQTGVVRYSCINCEYSYDEQLPKSDHKNVLSSTTRATTTKNGKLTYKCSVCGAISYKTIYYPKTFTLSTSKYTYDGKVKKPSLTVKDSAGKTISSSNYTITYPSGRKNVGKYTYKVTFKGNYSGTKSVSFTIVPKSTSISSLSAASKGFTVKWKKQATQTTGYQIQIATDSKFTKGVKSYTITKNSTLSKKITKLSGKKKYYVRIRTYKTVSGTKYYSSWSGSKSVTTKK